LCLVANGRARIPLATNATANAVVENNRGNGLTKTVAEQLIGTTK
jgi:hypothetical protein